jgi:hypothetical protein
MTACRFDRATAPLPREADVLLTAATIIRPQSQASS